jgi:hypothetical protein
MQYHAEGDVASDAQTKSKNDPLSHHVNLSMRPDGRQGIPVDGETRRRGSWPIRFPSR